MVDAQLKRCRRCRAGFTLIEILVVLLIITVLAGVVSVSVIHKPAEARVAAARMQIKQLKTAVNLFYAEQHRYPSQEEGLRALVQKPEGIRAEDFPRGGYLDTLDVPRDPWGRDYIYLAPGRHGEPFEIISYGSDGEPGGEGDAADISSSLAMQ